MENFTPYATEGIYNILEKSQMIKRLSLPNPTHFSKKREKGRGEEDRNEIYSVLVYE